MAKSIIQVIIIFIVGTIGGIFADQILWPYFIERPLFHEYRLEQSPVYLTEKTEKTFYIQENLALREAVNDVLPAVVGIKTQTTDGRLLEGSGLVLTSDGLIITLDTLLPKGSDFYFFVDSSWPAYQIIKRDPEANLALIKLEESGLKTRGFADSAKTKLAEPVFLIGTEFVEATSTDNFFMAPNNTVNEGIITNLNGELIETNIFEKEEMSGTPLFNIEGRVVGLSVVDETGRVSAIPVSALREFAGF